MTVTALNAVAHQYEIGDDTRLELRFFTPTIETEPMQISAVCHCSHCALDFPLEDAIRHFEYPLLLLCPVCGNDMSLRFSDGE